MTRGQEPADYFSVRVVTSDGLPVTCYNNLVLTPHCSMEECNPDVVFVPGILNIDETLQRNTSVIEWLKRQYRARFSNSSLRDKNA
jgi:transcriptional regulator GlxA family with amidase domain